MAGFPAATSNFDGIFARGPVGANNDPIGWLPAAASAKLRGLRQHVADMRSLLPDSGELNELRTARAASEARLKRLTDPAQRGGFNAGDDHPSVIAEKTKLSEIAAELDRLVAIDSERATRWRASGAIVTGVMNWLRTEIPEGHSLVAVIRRSRKS